MYKGNFEEIREEDEDNNCESNFSKDNTDRLLSGSFHNKSTKLPGGRTTQNFNQIPNREEKPDLHCETKKKIFEIDVNEDYENFKHI